MPSSGQVSRGVREHTGPCGQNPVKLLRWKLVQRNPLGGDAAGIEPVEDQGVELPGVKEPAFAGTGMGGITDHKIKAHVRPRR